MAAYSDTVEDDANAEAPVQSATLAVVHDRTESAEVRSYLDSERLLGADTIVEDANGAALWLQYDDLSADANGEGVVTGERRDLVELMIAAARGEGAVTVQTRHQTSGVVEDTASGAASALRAGRVLSDLLQEDVSAAGPIVSQRLAAAAPVLESVAGGSSALAVAALRAAVTLQEDVSGSAGEPPFFWDDARGEGTIVSAVLRAHYTAIADASAEAAIVSEAAARLLRDTLTASAQGQASVEGQQLQAVQTVVNDAEAADELLNVLSDEAWVFNSWTLAFSRYTGLGVNDVAAAADGRVLFTSPAGVHEFSDSSFADALVQFGLTSFGSLAPKRLRAVYVSTMGRGVVKLSTYHGSGGALVRHNYATPERDSAVPINRRISPSRGHTGQFWSLQVETTGGNRQTVTRIHVIPLITGRKL